MERITTAACSFIAVFTLLTIGALSFNPVAKKERPICEASRLGCVVGDVRPIYLAVLCKMV